MDRFRDDRFPAYLGMGRGRGRGRGGIPPDEDGGQDQIQAVGRARGRSRAMSSQQATVPDKAATGYWSKDSPSSDEPVPPPPRTKPSTWQRVDDLPKELLRKIFGNVGTSSSAGLEAKTPKNEDTEKEKTAEEDEENKAYRPPEGFLNPQDITLSYLLDTIQPGEERYCAVYTMPSSTAVYLILSKHFSKAVDGFIAEIGRCYWSKVRGGKLLELNVREEEVVAGAIVVVYHKGLREWKRAKIVGTFQGAQGKMYKVLFLDLGDVANVHSLDIVYMHETFKEKPVFAIKARLQLSPFYNCSAYRYNRNWDKDLCCKILDAVHNRKVLVKFIEKEEFENDKYWIVSLISMKDRPGFQESPGASSQIFSADQPIEQQVIAKMTGTEYIQ